MASFNGTHVPRSSGNCRSLPTQGLGLTGQAEQGSQTLAALGWVASLSLSYSGTKSFLVGFPLAWPGCC